MDANHKIIGTGYCKNTMKRKLSEALFIKELKPTPNKKEKSLPLKLINIIEYLYLLDNGF